MGILATARAARRTTGGIAMLLAAAWLGLAALPCSAGRAPAHDHGGPALPSDCDHCPPAPATTPDPCSAAAAGDCRDLGPTPAVERAGDQPLAVLPAGPPRLPAAAGHSGQRHAIRARAGPGDPATIQQRFCRYLI